jgi:hypothetical protein
VAAGAQLIFHLGLLFVDSLWNPQASETMALSAAITVVTTVIQAGWSRLRRAAAARGAIPIAAASNPPAPDRIRDRGDACSAPPHSGLPSRCGWKNLLPRWHSATARLAHIFQNEDGVDQYPALLRASRFSRIGIGFDSGVLGMLPVADLA